MAQGLHPPRSGVRREVIGRRVEPGHRQDGGSDFTYSVIETVSSRPGSERRADRRIPTRLREGLVRESRGRPIVECRIRDLTRSGARLQLDRERPLPNVFLLREAGTLRSFLATLVWQTGRDAGVKLTPIDEQKR